MPIIFISIIQEFVDYMNNHGHIAIYDRVENFKPNKKTYYVSPANSYGYMGGGIDYSLSKLVMPNSDLHLQRKIKHISPYKNEGNQHYIPISGSIIVDYNKTKILVSTPTMEYPGKDVSKTDNAYLATVTTLNNILVNRGEDINNVDIILTSFCAGHGRMDYKESARQMIDAINDYKSYTYEKINEDMIIVI